MFWKWQKYSKFLIKCSIIWFGGLEPLVIHVCIRNENSQVLTWFQVFCQWQNTWNEVKPDPLMFILFVFVKSILISVEFKKKNKMSSLLCCLGGSLAEMLLQYRQSSKQMTEAELKTLLLQIALGLKYVHSMNLVHLDIKPGRLFYLTSCQKQNIHKSCEWWMN